MLTKYFTEETFNHQDFTKEIFLKGEYSHCSFTNCNFEYVDLSEINFNNCTFNQCNLSLVKLMRTAFREVITNCQEVKRSGQLGTWITDDMIDAYCKLHDAGMAQSVEVWENDELVGGLYGIDLGHIFCGESMFSLRSNASKVGFVHLVEKLKQENYLLLDCQVYNAHLESLGAVEIDREDFLMILNSVEKREN